MMVKYAKIKNMDKEQKTLTLLFLSIKVATYVSNVLYIIVVVLVCKIETFYFKISTSKHKLELKIRGYKVDA